MVIQNMQVANNIISKAYFNVDKTTTNYYCNIRYAIKVLEKLDRVTIKMVNGSYLGTCIFNGERISVYDKDFPVLIGKLALKRLGYICTF